MQRRKKETDLLSIGKNGKEIEYNSGNEACP
jgi:hypothetical protein